ncbi:MAG: hypothetical protein HY699_16825 [Deltaproteobacteria bacterium]|nr:hypothetical protein [Deltaproteobacteria bacterium]
MMRQVHRRFQFRWQMGLLAGVATVATLGLQARRGWGFAEDITTVPSGSHSTFHYEFTRTLARAAGFSAADADFIAITDAATDTGAFTGDQEASVSVELAGTERLSQTGMYYHEARRHSANATGAYTYPGGRDTCAYFNDTSDPCAALAEVDEVELWAVYGTTTPVLGVPTLALNGGEPAAVASHSLAALGVYLHQLADSYSHEACMQAAQVRVHQPSPSECNAAYWHEVAEFGPSSSDVGVPYTIEAGKATWQVLKWFRAQNGLPEAALWTDERAETFITAWAKHDHAGDRRDFAVNAYRLLIAEATPTLTQEPPPTPSATPVPCLGDCGGDGEVTIDELVTGVNIALGTSALSECPEFDRDNNGEVTVEELVAGVNNALGSCA